MNRSLFLLPLLLSLGCTTSVVMGYEDGGTSAGTSGSSTTGQRAPSSSSAGATTGGAITGTGSSTSAGGGTTGTTGAGTTTGGTTGDAGPCSLAAGDPCNSNSDCCTGACDATCLQPAGGQCFSGEDCSSDNCVNDQCACATNTGGIGAECATDADCCNGVACKTISEDGIQYGECCNQVGGACQVVADCCDHSCVNGQCACLAPGYVCQSDADCCTGQCMVSADSQGYPICLNGPGQPCAQSYNCSTQSCVDGTCGSCGAPTASCSSAADCCSGSACVDYVAPLSTPEGPVPGSLVDAGFACCLPQGTTCDSDAGNGGCCSAMCADFTCACAGPTQGCDNDQSCCSGGDCLPAFSGESPFACCQQEAQLCFSGPECCSANCQNQKCACLAAGAECSYKGKFVTPAGAQACCSDQCGDGGVCL